MKKRNLAPAVVSFFIVGLGQIIKGEGKKGLLLILSFYFALPAAVYTSLLISGHFFLIALGLSLILGLFLWGYSIWNAYQASERP